MKTALSAQLGILVGKAFDPASGRLPRLPSSSALPQPLLNHMISNMSGNRQLPLYLPHETDTATHEGQALSKAVHKS